MRKHTWIAAFVVAGALFAFLAAPAARADSEQSEKTTIFAALTAMSGTEPPVTLTVAASGVTYTVNVTKDTNFVRRFGAKSVLTEFVLGDILEIKGRFTGGSDSTTIDAQWIKNYSIQRAGGTFNGKITSLDCSNSKFTLDPDGSRPNQTVKLSALTKILRGGVQIACTDLVANERVTVIGLWRQSINQIDADRVIVKLRTVEGTIKEITLTDGGLPAVIKITKKDSSATSAKKEDDDKNDEKSTEEWTINIDAETKILMKHLLLAEIVNFHVGDRIAAHGTVTAEKTLHALILRNLSRKKLKVSAEALRWPAAALLHPVQR